MKDGRTLGERVSDTIAAFGGSWTFIFMALGVVVLWVAINALPLFGIVQWDGYPFILLNLFLSLIAAFQAPFIMMSQRRCELKQDMAYRGLFAELKEELIQSKIVLSELASVLKDLKEVVTDQSSEIVRLEQELAVSQRSHETKISPQE